MKISLTGIQPTGEVHIGNYFGAIKPAIENSSKYQSFYFIADYHALNGIKDTKLIAANTLNVAASWLACGLDPKKVLFYRQSQIPQIFELETILSCFMPKGLLNRAHSYKDKVAKNREGGQSDDFDINVGLFSYPLLMASDILIFHSDLVPVGKDQKQHLEITAEVARIVNSSKGKSVLTVPKAQINEQMQVIGLDGRKMSKSYNNIIPLFASETRLKKIVGRVVTNSQSVKEKKDPSQSNIFALFSLFADEKEKKHFAKRFTNGGLGWGEAKAILFNKMNEAISPMRDEFDYLRANSKIVEKILDEGSLRAREIAQNNLRRIKRTLGF